MSASKIRLWNAEELTHPELGELPCSIVYLQSARPAQAEQVFTTYLNKHGEDGVVLTNLAKAQAAQGRDGEAEQTLWHALELDPNQKWSSIGNEVIT